MASTPVITSRRALLGALALAPAAAAAATLPAIAPAAAATPGGDTALHHVALAWIDRWKAAGGDFGVSRNRDGSIRSVMCGRTMPRFWQPTDESNPKLEPHIRLTERGHQSGAIRVLGAMLVMVPGLQDIVFDIVGAQRLAGGRVEAA